MFQADHARVDAASGFCFVNDIALAIQRFLSTNNNAKQNKSPPLKKLGSASSSTNTPAPAALPTPSFDRILYIDIDIHHGDGKDL